MNIGRLHRVGRHLQEAAIRAMRDQDDADLSRAQLAIQGDVYLHPGTSVGGIAARTGFTQGHVSACLARLREMGRVSTAPDPEQRRRTLVRLTPAAIRGIDKRVTRGAEDLLAEILGHPTAARLRRTVAVLEDLDSHLTRHDPAAHDGASSGQT
jgi:DNA-binding MarR family transcriptional regulator